MFNPQVLGELFHAGTSALKLPRILPRRAVETPANLRRAGTVTGDAAFAPVRVSWFRCACRRLRRAPALPESKAYF